MCRCLAEERVCKEATAGAQDRIGEILIADAACQYERADERGQHRHRAAVGVVAGDVVQLAGKLGDGVTELVLEPTAHRRILTKQIAAETGDRATVLRPVPMRRVEVTADYLGEEMPCRRGFYPARPFLTRVRQRNGNHLGEERFLAGEMQVERAVAQTDGG